MVFIQFSDQVIDGIDRADADGLYGVQLLGDGEYRHFARSPNQGFVHLHHFPIEVGEAFFQRKRIGAQQADIRLNIGQLVDGKRPHMQVRIFLESSANGKYVEVAVARKGDGNLRTHGKNSRL